jgi:hypothetical protein
MEEFKILILVAKPVYLVSSEVNGQQAESLQINHFHLNLRGWEDVKRTSPYCTRCISYLFPVTNVGLSSKRGSSVVDPHHLDADPDLTYHPDADPDAYPDLDFYLTWMRIRLFTPMRMLIRILIRLFN